mmetsp:Transcript_147292/g.382926  ORF Transcript_147292/g.382926 Transcript_147292/m.382926 type:complete len:238 (+) Transcript_147292:839-1552(+)
MLQWHRFSYSCLFGRHFSCKCFLGRRLLSKCSCFACTTCFLCQRNHVLAKRWLCNWHGLLCRCLCGRSILLSLGLLLLPKVLLRCSLFNWCTFLLRCLFKRGGMLCRGSLGNLFLGSCSCLFGQWLLVQSNSVCKRRTLLRGFRRLGIHWRGFFLFVLLMLLLLRLLLPMLHWYGLPCFCLFGCRRLSRKSGIDGWHFGRRTCVLCVRDFPSYQVCFFYQRSRIFSKRWLCNRRSLI